MCVCVCRGVCVYVCGGVCVYTLYVETPKECTMYFNHIPTTHSYIHVLSPLQLSSVIKSHSLSQ